MARHRIEVTKNQDNDVMMGDILFENRKILSFEHEYDDAGLLRAVSFIGKKQNLPSAIDLYKVAVGSKFPEQLKAVLNLESVQSLYQTTTGETEQTRTPDVYRTETGNLNQGGAGVDIWTPTTGKQFRLMGVSVSGNAGDIWHFKDGGAGGTEFLTMAQDRLVPLQGNGYLSLAVDNVLNVVVSTVNNNYCTVWGCEE